MDQTKTSQQLDFYNMVGYCPSRIITKCAGFSLRNLVDASDKEIMEMQNELIGYISHKLLKIKKKATGIILHSGSEANEIAVYLAKKKTGRNIVLASNISHTSVKNACSKLGMELLAIDVNEKNFQLNQKELIKVLEEKGQEIALLNVTFGTTYFGSIEDFTFNPKVIELCQKHGIWVHVDAAYGGTIMSLLKPNFSEAYFSSEIVCSVTVDTHKFIGVVGAGVLILTNPKLKSLIGTEATYFKGHTTALGTTRGALPIATALTMLKELGYPGLKRLASACLKKANWVGEELKKAGFELLYPVESGVVSVKLSSEKETEYWKSELFSKGFKVSPIKLFGKHYVVYGIRIVVTPKKEMNWSNIRLFSKQFRV